MSNNEVPLTIISKERKVSSAKIVEIFYFYPEGTRLAFAISPEFENSKKRLDLLNL